MYTYGVIDKKIAVDTWHELNKQQKEILREWAVTKGIGLEIVQSQTAETCDYAVLLTSSQIHMFLNERGEMVLSDDLDTLWSMLKHKL